MKDDGNNQLRKSCAEAHIYVAILKADKNISAKEMVEAFFHARKSQKKLNVLNANSGIADSIVRQIRQIIKNSDYFDWDCYAHLDYAVKMLSELKQSGEWSVKLVFDKMESGLKKLVLIDGYDIKESKFLELVLSKLEKLKEG